MWRKALLPVVETFGGNGGFLSCEKSVFHDHSTGGASTPAMLRTPVNLATKASPSFMAPPIKLLSDSMFHVSVRVSGSNVVLARFSVRCVPLISSEAPLKFMDPPSLLNVTETVSAAFLEVAIGMVATAFGAESSTK